MWLESLFPNPWVHDIIATVITFAVALGFLRIMDAIAHRGLIDEKLSRKIIHIGTGPLFVLCWVFFSEAEPARYLAALVPAAITGQFFAVGMGLMKDEAAVKAMSRTGNPREILRGPLYYGIVFVIATVLFWRNSAIGMMALMLMCGGDGLADVIGRRFGTAKLPWSDHKSWAGSAAMFMGGFAFGLAFILLFQALGFFTLPPLGLTVLYMAIIAAAATAVEAIPARDIDNITITVTAIVLGLVFFG